MNRTHKQRDQAYAVVRVDLPVSESEIAQAVTVKEVVSSREVAEREVQRLSSLNSDKNCLYFATPTRVFPPGSSAVAAEAEIDVSDVSTPRELHDRIAEALRFPDYYGRNWDAFDECSRDPEIPVPQVVRVLGFQSILGRLPREAALMQRCFSEREAEGGFRVAWGD